MNSGYQIFEKEANLIQLNYPELKLEANQEGKAPCLKGYISLKSENESIIDRYCIKIMAIPDYPDRFPIVFELGNRIPNNIDWHVNLDGHFCISSIPEEILICRKGITLHDFIENHVKPYLFNQKYRELKGFFLKERSHGNKGNIEFFYEVFKSNDLMTILNGLNFVRRRKEPNRVNLCFCGSHKKYRHCHKQAYQVLSTFTNPELDSFIEMTIQYKNSQKF